MAMILGRHVALGPRAEPRSESLSELYHENTKLRPLPGAGMVVPGHYTTDELQAMARAYKRYRLHTQVPLPAPRELPPNSVTFDDVVAARRSVRSFADADLELDELAKILHQSSGITGGVRIPGGGVHHFRAAPSAGALYPAEIYLGIRRVAGLVPGIYHYEVPEHGLAMLSADDPTERLYEVCCRQAYAREAAVVVLIAGVMPRTKRKYRERGYRYILLDVGHLTQNLYLACTALGLAVTTTGGFFDDVANELLHLDGVDETVLYVAFIGKSEAMATPGLVSTTGVEDWHGEQDSP